VAPARILGRLISSGKIFLFPFSYFGWEDRQKLLLKNENISLYFIYTEVLRLNEVKSKL
jgi:hypothetical protein